ncbi:MAG: hypothetical protein L0H96_11675 [Humibacillus sp.]|nr:hypothetical protein [Humibacillus sp.]MDN5777563.1 hypothetical protein [Humibacillus sp.]
MADHEENHGHSKAAWTTVGIILLGCLIGCVAVLMPSLLLGGVAAVVIIAGAITGRLMSMAGMGSDGHHAQAGGLVDAPDEVGAETQGKS